jgi:hypothetical protein
MRRPEITHRRSNEPELTENQAQPETEQGVEWAEIDQKWVKLGDLGGNVCMIIDMLMVNEKQQESVL